MPRQGRNRCLERVVIEAWVKLLSVSRIWKWQKDEGWWRVMKGDEGWICTLHPLNPLCLWAFWAKRWRVKGFCVIHFYNYFCCFFINAVAVFYNYCCSQSAYLWHNSALLWAHLCLSKSNFTGGGEVILPTSYALIFITHGFALLKVVRRIHSS